LLNVCRLQNAFLLGEEEAAVRELQTKQAEWLDEKLKLMDERNRASETMLSLQEQVRGCASYQSLTYRDANNGRK
jgi:hypothetical protein